ncbi:SIS domain-containing protein [Agrobacterium tumefaciens]|uniref:SIS domain-containing protein n=1 Tax=Agrobacterium tumefaciens TaxID=358 RepID=A0AAP9E8Y6_AGRTU|nr:SIS domain-containing protein [Agrobacterium tumefaciens]NSZ60845.1 SIS domain-containing protein [Agrobacterium tumefaciens]QDY97180.1 SIS domain-containing protein [Agrobacterium tumefaciens]UXS47430.1 SIS domain-containing protein [Agrobacterium tumefaciens]UXS71990.1 SIS domain-containing protein [Agrobacterium tumefaciens]UXS81173.1 SIS domain-containing protein [Agrobacterium tumefaciens]
MTTDPRHRNRKFDGSDIASFARDYVGAFGHAMESLDFAALERAAEVVFFAGRDGKRIYVVGNGGSAAIADHLCCDWTKGTSCSGHSTIKTHSLSSNVALYSAIANDYGFENVFSTQVDFFGEAGDVLIAISSSGNSGNILAAVKHAQDKGMSVIGLSGFGGGKLKDACDISLHAAADNYGVVEDCHQAMMHIIAQFIANRRDETNPV